MDSLKQKRKAHRTHSTSGKFKEKNKAQPDTLQEQISACNTCSSSKNRTIYLIAIIAVMGIALGLAIWSGITYAPSNIRTARMDLYVMSQCPYGIEVENALLPLKERMGNALDVNVNFIGEEKPQDQFNSMHGPAEVQGDMIQLCVKQYYPQDALAFMVCQNENPKNLAGSIEKCAKANGMDFQKIESCIDSGEGKKLLSASFNASAAAGAQGSPTMFIGGKPYNGGRDTLSFTKAVCVSIQGNHPLCKEIPACATDANCTAEPKKEGSCSNSNTKDAVCVYNEPTRFEVVAITAKACASCDTSDLFATLRQLFLGADITELDASVPKAQELIAKNNIQKLPAYLFAPEVSSSSTWKSNPNLQSAFVQVPFGFRIRDEATGASYFVDDNARDAYYRLLGVTPDDNRPQIDFFIMSYCPYGNEAEEAIKPVFDRLGESADFHPHYVIYEDYQGGGPRYCFDSESNYCSMHGIQELNQDLRERCVVEEYGTQKYFDFALTMNTVCSAQNADTCWKDVASSVGIDTALVEQCFESRTTEILAREKELNGLYGASGSPTVFIDGEKYAGSRTPAGYMRALCNAFDHPPEACNGIEEMDDGQNAAQGPSQAAAGGCGV